MEHNKRIIAQLDGAPVIGIFNDDDCDPDEWGRPYGLDYHWSGRHIGMARGNRGQVLVELLGFSTDNMELSEYGALRELVTSGVIERLIPIARAFFDGARWEVPYPAEEPPATWAAQVATDVAARRLDDLVRQVLPEFAEELAALPAELALRQVRALVAVVEQYTPPTREREAAA